jgi:hypothetical protein
MSKTADKIVSGNMRALAGARGGVGFTKDYLMENCIAKIGRIY